MQLLVIFLKIRKDTIEGCPISHEFRTQQKMHDNFCLAKEATVLFLFDMLQGFGIVNHEPN